MKVLSSSTLAFLFLFCLVLPVNASVVINEIAWPVKAAYAANGLKMGTIVINEIAWMGTKASYNDEWIELYNNSGLAISLGHWKLISEDEEPEINLQGEIPAKGFFLLERTDDQTLPDIEADLIYKGGLHNQGEHLKLINSQAEIIDEVDCSSAWFAGDNKTKQTMEKKNPLLPGNTPENWQNSESAGGTPKSQNSQIFTEKQDLSESPESGTPESIPKEKELAENSSPLIKEEIKEDYPGAVIFNEILPSPEGPDAENEWIELKNLNNRGVDLSEWKVQDIVGSTVIYTFPEGTKIGAGGFLVLSRPMSKITLNNSGDGLLLIQPNGNIADRIDYEKAALGQSYNKIDSDWIWNPILTPGSENVLPPQDTEKGLSKKDETEKTLSTLPQKSQETTNQKELAAVGEYFTPTIPFSIFLIASIIAIFSGTIILILKTKLKDTNQSD